jgi:cytochrome oxidase assembly protein ShyY1
MLALHVLGVVAVTVAVLLGLWQYDAWQAGRALAARDLADAPPVALDRVLGPDDPYPGDRVGQPVELSGRWLPDSTVEVTGKRLDGRDGRWVVTPVAVCGAAADCADAPAILVVRGFAPDRTVAPAAPQGPVELSGWLQPGEGQGLPDPDPGDAVLPELRVASAVQHVDTDLYGGYVIADEPTPGLDPVTPAALPEPDSFTSLRNLFYAGEWWVFAGFAVFLWWRWARDELERVAAATRDREGDGSDEPAPAPEIASAP